MLLILDFTDRLNLAILDKKDFIKKKLNSKRNISEILIQEVDYFFKKSDKDINRLNSICIITGPGSFTGIRSALTFAKILKLKLKIKIFGISKFDLINFCTLENSTHKKKIILLHFKKNKFFSQLFIKNVAYEEPKLINLEEYNTKNMKNISFICDNKVLEKYLTIDSMAKIKDNLHFIDYNINKLPQIIKNNIIENEDVKPLYISNYS